MFFVMLELVPSENNEEKEYCEGAFLDCWVDCDSEAEAVEKAKDYASSEGWDYVETKEVYEVQREKYLDDDEILEIYDEACDYGVSGLFYTWPDEDEE